MKLIKDNIQKPYIWSHKGINQKLVYSSQEASCKSRTSLIRIRIARCLLSLGSYDTQSEMVWTKIDSKYWVVL